ncbi:unnamed protein product [Chrysoparadoxa australica]
MMVPGLVYLRLGQQQAHASSLAAVLTTGLAGAWGYASAGQVDWTAAVAMAIPGSFGASVGARLAAQHASKLKKGFGGLLICSAPLVAFRASSTQGSSNDAAAAGNAAGPPDSKLGVNRTAKMATIGVCTGCLSGLFGVGGGIVAVPLLRITTDLPHHEILGTSLAAMVLPAATACYSHSSRGLISRPVALPLALGSALGAYGGSRYSSRYAHEEQLRFAFSLVMVFMGGRMMMR